jgi:hypothetical protein
MAGATLTTADAALKNFYVPGSQGQLNNDIPFLNQIEKNTKDIEGRYAVLAPTSAATAASAPGPKAARCPPPARRATPKSASR